MYQKKGFEASTVSPVAVSTVAAPSTVGRDELAEAQLAERGHSSKTTVHGVQHKHQRHDTVAKTLLTVCTYS